MEAKYDETLLEQEEVARILSFNVSTIRRWIKRGYIKAYRLPSGKLRIPASEVQRIKKPITGGENNGRL